MYMKKSWNEDRCREYYSFLLSEQDPRSPHRYLDDEIKKKKMDIVIDGGGAESSFAISVLKQCKEIFVVECDEEWIEALQMTFRNFKNTVHIVPRLLGNIDYNMTTTIDSIAQGKKIDFIKLDVEGDELVACKGSLGCINNNPQIDFLICVYHYQNEENDIKMFFKNMPSIKYEIYCRKGYIYFYHDNDQKPPYLRRGVLKISLCGKR